jgi:hypothetical protein
MEEQTDDTNWTYEPNDIVANRVVKYEVEMRVKNLEGGYSYYYLMDVVDNNGKAWMRKDDIESDSYVLCCPNCNNRPDWDAVSGVMISPCRNDDCRVSKFYHTKTREGGDSDE